MFKRLQKLLIEGSLGDESLRRKRLSKNSKVSSIAYNKQKNKNYAFNVDSGFATNKGSDPLDTKRIARRIRKQKSTDMSRVDKYKYIKGIQ